MSNSFLYQVTRVLGNPVFKNKYNQKIVDKDNIPSDGPIILCGNHISELDPFVLISSTKRTIHFLLDKDSYDEGSKSLLKMMGMISVNDDDLESSMKYYLDYGGCTCFFPEGERNILTEAELYELYKKKDCKVPFNEFKELVDKNTLLSQIEYLESLYKSGVINLGEYKIAVLHAKTSLLELVDRGIINNDNYDDSLLLPFSTKAVEIAKETGATIVPFAINGIYDKIGDNLVIRFGKGFKVSENDDIADVNFKLREKVKTLVKENIKNKF
ncbi:MAG: 1-acyl-sn-glycerol-3-phosphate acyltransferase [Bacilli bacterium]|nr:1-acyl-sn-glycerol-3-phosphate acyltransferase [Bacilli bacterium]